MRQSTINRKTAETDIALTLNLDGRGESKIDSGCGFLDHMLTLFARHGGFDLAVTCKGDVQVDFHHTVEDVGICLGRAVAELAGDKKGLARYGSMLLPMDEALVLTAVDLSGRAMLCYLLPLYSRRVGNFDIELVKEFFVAFVREAKMTLHVRKMAGKNTHHVIEAAFKSLGHSLAAALQKKEGLEGAVLSTKEVL